MISRRALVNLGFQMGGVIRECGRMGCSMGRVHFIIQNLKLSSELVNGKMENVCAGQMERVALVRSRQILRVQVLEKNRKN